MHDIREAPAPPHPPIDDVTALLVAVARTSVAAPTPAATASHAERCRYLGAVDAIAFDRDERARVELIARLMALAGVAVRERLPDAEATAPLRRLERRLRRWERDRRRGISGPRPGPHELDARISLFASTLDELPLIGIDTVAIAVAEVVAVDILAGTVSVEEGMGCVADVEPLVQAARHLLVQADGTPVTGAHEQPGAALAHVEHTAWQLDQLHADLHGREVLLWARALWLEVAAALVFAYGAHGREPERRTWREVQRLAVEKLLVGELRATPADYDLRRALALVRSAALTTAATWLDEALGDVSELATQCLPEQLVDAAAQAILAAWSLERRCD